MARPKLNINGEEVQKLASFGCTNVEIADFFNCNEATIRKGYSEYLTKGRSMKNCVYDRYNGRLPRMAMRLWLSG